MVRVCFYEWTNNDAIGLLRDYKGGRENNQSDDQENNQKIIKREGVFCLPLMHFRGVIFGVGFGV